MVVATVNLSSFKVMPWASRLELHMSSAVVVAPMRDCECCEVTVLLCKVLCQFLFIVSALVKKEKKTWQMG